MSQFPWSALKLDTIQAVLADLGLEPYTRKSSVRQIVKILRDIETDGLEAATQELASRQSAATSTSTVPLSARPGPAYALTHARSESPEIEYYDPIPRAAPISVSAPVPAARARARSVPVVEISTPARRPPAPAHVNAQAGPSRPRPRTSDPAPPPTHTPASAKVKGTPKASTSASAKVKDTPKASTSTSISANLKGSPKSREGAKEPPAKRRKVAALPVPPPSYAILYNEQQGIKLKADADKAEDVDGDVDGDSDTDREADKDSASASGKGKGKGKGKGSARRLEVVVKPVSAVKAQWKRGATDVDGHGVE